MKGGHGAGVLEKDEGVLRGAWAWPRHGGELPRSWPPAVVQGRLGSGAGCRHGAGGASTCPAGSGEAWGISK